MISIAIQAWDIYDNELTTQLEADHLNKFVAIEPVSKSHFLGTTFVAAAMSAKQAYPSRKSFVILIGHDAAFHIGASQS